jgi:hypothetical protein
VQGPTRGVRLEHVHAAVVDLRLQRILLLLCLEGLPLRPQLLPRPHPLAHLAARRRRRLPALARGSSERGSKTPGGQAAACFRAARLLGRLDGGKQQAGSSASCCRQQPQAQPRLAPARRHPPPALLPGPPCHTRHRCRASGGHSTPAPGQEAATLWDRRLDLWSPASRGGQRQANALVAQFLATRPPSLCRAAHTSAWCQHGAHCSRDGHTPRKPPGCA